MRLHRFIGEFDLSSRRVSVRDSGLANQLKNVLRLNVGDAVRLCDGKGNEATAAIASIGKATVEFDVVSVEANEVEAGVEVTLYCAVLKRENFEVIAQKATEVGVATIVPVITRRTVKLQLRNDRLRKIMKEAAEQSGRGSVPQLSEPMIFEKALAASAGVETLFFELGGGDVMDALKGKKPASMNVFVGPEGGWDPQEVERAKDAGCVIVGLGRRVLRAETAATIAAYLAVASGGR